jgi:hypothetical protein
MSFTRRHFIKSGLTTTGLMLSSTLPFLPTYTFSKDSKVITISFSGTACTRDEGEETRKESNKDIYLPETGYIPVRINKEIGGLSETVRGVGENDWHLPRDSSEGLQVDGPLIIPKGLKSDVAKFAKKGNYLSTSEQLSGSSMPALALHAANIAAASGATTINLIGHSRGACECIMAAWFLYAYGGSTHSTTQVNIFAIDPVPGTGEWYGILTQLPPNVTNYVGVYAWDHIDGLNHAGHPFQALVPRPNGLMRSETNNIILQKTSDWKKLADKAQQTNPLKPFKLGQPKLAQPKGYELYACRGMHGTVAGNTTADGKYEATNSSAQVAPVPALIYKMARGYLTKWGTTFTEPCAIPESIVDLRRSIHREHSDFDKMGGGETRNSSIMSRPYVRRISSKFGRNPLATYYMDDVVGDPPYKLAYPVTKERENAGWVKWKFL